MNEFDAKMDQIRVSAYNIGLFFGFKVGSSLSPDVAKSALRAIRKSADAQSPGVWDRQTQISYVITLGVAAVRAGFSPALP